MCVCEEGWLVCQSSRGVESLLKGPALEKPAKAINRICNGRDGTEGGMMGKLRVAEGVDANSRSPKRKEGGGKAKAGSVSHNSKSIERANTLTRCTGSFSRTRVEWLMGLRRVYVWQEPSTWLRKVSSTEVCCSVLCNNFSKNSTLQCYSKNLWRTEIHPFYWASIIIRETQKSSFTQCPSKPIFGALSVCKSLSVYICE